MAGDDQAKLGQGGSGAGPVAKAFASVTQTAKEAFNSATGMV